MDGCRSKQSQGVGSEQGTALIIRRYVIVSNSLGQISDPRLIGSISSMTRSGQSDRDVQMNKCLKSKVQHII